MSFSTWLNRNFGHGSDLDNFLTGIDKNLLGGAFGRFRKTTNAIAEGIPSVIAGATGSDITGADKVLMEHQDQREDTYYQRTMADMKAAGINPMMAAGQSGTSPSTAQSNNAPTMDLNAIMQLSMLPMQKEMMKAQINNLNAGAEEKKSKVPYWQQVTDESKKRIEKLQSAIDKDIAETYLKTQQGLTEEQLRGRKEDLMVSQRALADAQTSLAQEQESETAQRKALEAMQTAYQKSLNDNDMAFKVCEKIVAETHLAGAQANTEQQKALASRLANAMIRGDFVKECLEQLNQLGHDGPNILGRIMSTFNNILGMINFTIGI